ncbi:hypothetical protein D9M71_535750 [compost metagenome]
MRLTRASALHAALAYQRGAAGQVAGVGQGLQRNRHVIGVCQVLGTVGIGQALSLGDQVHGQWRCLQAGRRCIGHRPQCCQVALRRRALYCFENAQGLQHRHPTRRRRWHAADLPGLVGAAHRLALLGLILLQVLQRQVTGIGMAAHLGHHGFGDLAAVERFRTLRGDLLQGLRKFRITQGRAHRQWLALLIQEVTRHGG